MRWPVQSKICILMLWIIPGAVVLPGGPLYGQNGQSEGEAAAEDSEPSRQAEAFVEGIDVQREGTRVRISVERTDSGEELIAFRNIRPIDSSDILSESVEVARLSGNTSSFSDNPAPGVPAYYAVFSARSLAERTPAFQEGENFTRTAFTLPRDTTGAALAEPGSQEFTRRRSRPLPRLIPELSPLTGDQLPPRALSPIEPRPIREETQQAIEHMLERVPEPDRSPPEIQILEPEREEQPKDVGETAVTLRQIVRTTIRDRRWDQAVGYLEGLLTLPLAEAERLRTHYYLGIARFFREEYRQAVLSMLQAQEELYEYARPWIDTALDRIADEDSGEQ